MDRRTFIVLTGALLAAPHRAHALRPPAISRIGFLYPTSPEDAGGVRLHAFRDGMRDLGYVEGTHFVLDARFDEGKSEQLGSMAADLVRSRVRVIALSLIHI